MLTLSQQTYTTKLTSKQLDPSIINRFFPEENNVHLSQEEHNSREGPLMENEFLSSLKQMANSKAV